MVPRLLCPIVFAALLALPSPARAAPTVTAGQVVERIRNQVACTRRQTQTVDTFKAGDPNARITGIATTFAATFDVLRRAAASGKNLIISHEPTFYEHREETREIEGDPVLEAKRAFIRQHGLVIWRFHDLSHCREPDLIDEGMIEAMGWDKHRRSGEPPSFTLPQTTVGALARDLARRLKARTVRIVGNRETRITQVGFLPGATDSVNQIRLLARDDVELLVVGESREWETVEYARDAVAQGRKKALILLGHVPSEESGMARSAVWLKGFIPEVPIEFIPAGDPFQSPG